MRVRLQSGLILFLAAALWAGGDNVAGDGAPPSAPPVAPPVPPRDGAATPGAGGVRPPAAPVPDDDAAAANGEDGLDEPDPTSSVYFWVMPTHTTVYLRDNTKAQGHVLLQNDRGLILLEPPGEGAADGPRPERWIAARDIRSLREPAPAAAPAPVADPGRTARTGRGAADRWPGFVLRHAPDLPADAASAAAAEKAAVVTAEEAIVFPKYEAKLDKGWYVVQGPTQPDGGGAPAGGGGGAP